MTITIKEFTKDFTREERMKADARTAELIEEELKPCENKAGIVKCVTDATWPSAEAKARSVAQAKALRQQAAEGGLRFNAYLPPKLASWLLERIEQGMFLDPSEGVFVILGEHEQLEPHADLRTELLRRTLQVAINDPRPDIPAKQVSEELRKELSGPRPEPACWESSPRE